MFARTPWLLVLGSMAAALATVLSPGGHEGVSAQTPCVNRGVPRVTAVRIPLDPTDAGRREVGQLRYRGGILLQHEDHRFGSFSGMVVTQNGNRLAAVNNGYWLESTLRYDNSGDLSGFETLCFGQLLDEQGRPLEWWEDSDAESLTFDGERYLVGFEENLRVWSYRDFSGPARNVPLPPDFAKGVPLDAGYSSIASDGPGRFYVITEFGRNAAKDTKGYMHTDAAKGDFWIVAREERRPYMVVDLAALPGGNFVLAEIVPIQLADGSFDYQKLRLSTIEGASISPNSRITPHTIAEMEPPIVQEKYEAVASRLGPKGETLIYIMSDDGRRHSGRTVIRMFELITRQP